ncbi:hypothetical protein UlMin_000450 [Ulmus minor]
MAFYSALRKASESVIPLAIRSCGASRTYHGAVSTFLAVQKGNLRRELAHRGFVPFLRFSTEAAKRSADDKLIRVLESEIECAVEDQNDVEEMPERFPFEIKDNPGERTVLLTRQYEDETIKVEVDMPHVSVDDEDEEDADKQSTEESSIPLVVSITKGNGLHLEFGVTAFPDEISIDSLSLKQPEDSEEQLPYEGPEFSDLDENLQKALQKFLEVRGINASTTNFLHEYMMSKDSKEYLNWLKSLKDFVEH